MCASHIDCQELWRCPQDHVAQYQPHSTFPLAIKRSGGLDIRKEIDQLNRDGLGALLEQIIFFCHQRRGPLVPCGKRGILFLNLSPRLHQKRLAALSFY